MKYELRLHDSEILLNLVATDLAELVQQTVERLGDLGKFSSDQQRRIESVIVDEGPGVPRDLGGSVGVLVIRYDGTGSNAHVALVRVPDGVRASDHERVHFLWVVLATHEAPIPHDQALEPFAWMLRDEHFSASILGSNDPTQVLTAYQLYLEYVEAPPDQRRPSLIPHYPSLPPPTKGRRFAHELARDFHRRRPHYKDDFSAGVHRKGVATILFLFFACLAPSVAFGGLLAFLTDGQIGAVEAILATAVGGVVYALFSGQPLTLLGSTGPITIFFGLLYELCVLLGVPFLPGLFWVGLWTSVIMAILAVSDASRYIAWFTRFTDEIFGALIAMIFIVAAVESIFGGLIGREPDSGKLLALILALGTYMIAHQLSRMRRAPLILPRVREFLADFGPAIAIFVMTGVGFAMAPMRLEHLAVPESFTTTMHRPWLVNPLDVPPWFIFASVLLAALGSVLLYLDQNITVRLVNSPHHHLKKGGGYNLDMMVISVLVLICAMFGLPWVVAATVRSLNHVRSLATFQHHAHGEHIISVRENRLTGLVVHLLIGSSLFFLGLLRQVPMSVLFGLFLYMGIASLRGNQFVDRLKLWVTDPTLFPPTHYVRRVPRKVIHRFTAVQALCLAMLWVVKSSALGVLFPLFIALLVPIRHVLGKIFNPTHLAFLDADEVPNEEQYREMD